MHLRGQHVLHASAVERDGRALAFTAMSGTGKSTLAASFVARGFSLVADDGVRLERHADAYDITPSYPGLRLWSQSIEALSWNGERSLPVGDDGEKKRVRPRRGAFSSSRSRLSCIYFIERSSEVRTPETSRLRPGDALFGLLEATFRCPLPHTARAGDEFAALTDLVARVPVRRLRMPDDLRCLSQVCELVQRENGY
jgi:hypothetical protein